MDEFHRQGRSPQFPSDYLWVLLILVPFAVLFTNCSHDVLGSEIRIETSEELRHAIADAQPGQTILLAPGEYRGEMIFDGVRGLTSRPIVIAGARPDMPPVIRGGGTGMQLKSPAHVVLRDLVFDGAALNGINIDDGGRADQPAHDIILKNLTFRNIGTQGNDDCIKLSRVNGFRVEDCTMAGWGREGQAVDVTGCEGGEIVDCRFDGQDKVKVGIQVKGGSRLIRVQNCSFSGITDRAAQIGGTTGAKFFHAGQNFAEASQVILEDCSVVGSEAPIALVGVDGVRVHRNVIYCPTGWFCRILQENNDARFVPCRNGLFSENVIVWRNREMVNFVNVGAGTASETFRFRENYWYCLDHPGQSRPTGLPTAEEQGVYGENPELLDPDHGDLRLGRSRAEMRAASDRAGHPLWKVGAFVVVSLLLLGSGLLARRQAGRLWTAVPSAQVALTRSAPPPSQNDLGICALLWAGLIAIPTVSQLTFITLETVESASPFENFFKHPWGIDPHRKSDWVANFLAFFPFGLLVAGWSDADRTSLKASAVRLFFALLSIIAFAVSLELLQSYTPEGIVSRNDALAAVLGGAIGMLSWLLLGQVSVNRLRCWTRTCRPRQAVDVLLIAYTCGLIVYALYPLEFVLQPLDLYHKLNSGAFQLVPFHGSELEASQLILVATVFVPIGYLTTSWGTTTRHPVRSGRSGFLLALAVLAFVESAQLLVRGGGFDATNIVCGSVGAGMGVLLARKFAMSSPLWSPVPPLNTSWVGPRRVFAWGLAGSMVLLIVLVG